MTIRSASPTSPSPQDNVLILQGGGALGAYQAGVHLGLHEKGIPINWIVGTSIGAINAALIAGNPPETRVSRIEEFWRSLTPHNGIGLPSFQTMFGPWASMMQSMNTFGTLMNGVEGFFKPRFGAGWDMEQKVPLSDVGFYDTSPLKATLERFVDFDYLNEGAVRICVCAVDIDTGEGVVFDSAKQKIRAEHIMASGALPPGFPPVEIGKKAYWDGGIYSNSPLEVFLKECGNRDALCFMVDIWDPSEPRPKSIAEAMARYKSIQYSSRSKEDLANHQKIQNLRRAIRVLAEKLPEAERQQKDIEELLSLGRDHTVSIVHLTMKAREEDSYFKDIDFSAEAIEARWQSGLADCKRALRHEAWLRPIPPHAGLVIHELPQQE